VKLKKFASFLFVSSALVAMIGASAPNEAQAMKCQDTSSQCGVTTGGGGGGGGSGGGGGGGGGTYCPPQGIYTCVLYPTGAWVCKYWPC
jgi:hypothetical protein